MSLITGKHCRKCGEFKPFDLFKRNKLCYFGVTGTCLSCSTEEANNRRLSMKPFKENRVKRLDEACKLLQALMREPHETAKAEAFLAREREISLEKFNS